MPLMPKKTLMEGPEYFPYIPADKDGKDTPSARIFCLTENISMRINMQISVWPP
jgi:hypothetical protein